MKIEMASLHKSAAKVFVKSKGRTPVDSAELVEWLMEFTAMTGDLLLRTQQAYTEHLVICNRRTFVKGEEP